LPPLVARRPRNRDNRDRIRSFACGKNGELQLIDGVTRCARVGMLLPGQPITVEVIETRPNLDLSRFPTVGDKLP
jgi:hypothetical protein